MNHTDTPELSALELAREAIDAIESWAGYASDYFKTKHRYEEEIAGYRSRLVALSSASTVRGDARAYVIGDDASRELRWMPDKPSFDLPVGTLLYAAPSGIATKIVATPADHERNRLTNQTFKCGHGVALADLCACCQVLIAKPSSAQAGETAPHGPTCKCPKCEVDRHQAAPSSAQAGEPSDEQWYDIAQAHAMDDWNSDGYLEAVKSVGRDAIRAALATQVSAPADDICQSCKGAGGTQTSGLCPECYGQGTYSGARASMQPEAPQSPPKETQDSPKVLQSERMRNALWTLTEHNRLHFGDSHNTVIAGEEALRALSMQPEAPQAPAQGEALRIADAIDPLTRTATLDNLTLAVAAKLLRASMQPEAPQAAQITDAQIGEWWRTDNGLEDCDMCKLDDFRKVVRAVEKKLAALSSSTATPDGGKV